MGLNADRGCIRIHFPSPNAFVVAQDRMVAEQLQREEFRRADEIGPGFQGGVLLGNSRGNRTRNHRRGRGRGIRHFQHSPHSLHCMDDYGLPGHHINVSSRNSGLFHCHGGETGNGFNLYRLGVSSSQLTGVRPEALDLMMRQSEFTPEDYEMLVKLLCNSFSDYYIHVFFSVIQCL